jgi:hypothetical protein
MFNKINPFIELILPIFEAALRLKGGHISQRTLTCSLNQNILQIDTVKQEFPVTLCDDEYEESRCDSPVRIAYSDVIKSPSTMRTFTHWGMTCGSDFAVAATGLLRAEEKYAAILLRISALGWFVLRQGRRRMVNGSSRKRIRKLQDWKWSDNHQKLVQTPKDHLNDVHKPPIHQQGRTMLLSTQDMRN